MGTRFAVTCYPPDVAEAREAVDAAFEAAAAVNAVASDYIADSELLSLSRQPAGTATPVSPLLFRLLSEACMLAEKTNGCFDPTLGPVTRLWRESRRRGKLPDPAILDAARAACGWKHLVLEEAGRTATLSLPGMRLDLGGIAKGQAADAMLEVMTTRGIPRACITAGGDIRAGEPPPGEAGWKIGIRTFREEEQDALRISNSAASTSGDLHQSIEIEGKRYSHIIDPATGLGLTRPSAVTVIAPLAMLSDAIATACCVAPPGEAKRLGLAAGATSVLPG